MPKAVSSGPQAPQSKTAQPHNAANNNSNNNNLASAAIQHQQQVVGSASGNPRQAQLHKQSQHSQLRCYLCETPKQEYSLIMSTFSEVVCRGCLNYEGPDRVEQLIKSARYSKANSLSPADLYASAAGLPPAPYLLGTEAMSISQASQLAPASRSRRAAPAPAPSSVLYASMMAADYAAAAQLSSKGAGEKLREEGAPPSKSTARSQAKSRQPPHSANEQPAQKQPSPAPTAGRTASGSVEPQTGVEPPKSGPASGGSLNQQIQSGAGATGSQCQLAPAPPGCPPAPTSTASMPSPAGRGQLSHLSYQTVGSPVLAAGGGHPASQPSPSSLERQLAQTSPQLGRVGRGEASGAAMMPLMVARGEPSYGQPAGFELVSGRLGQHHPAAHQLMRPPADEQAAARPPGATYHSAGQPLHEQVANPPQHPYYVRAGNQFQHPATHRPHAAGSPRQSISGAKPLVGDAYHQPGYPLVGPYMAGLAAHHPHHVAAGQNCQYTAYCLPTGQLHSYLHHLPAAQSSPVMASPLEGGPQTRSNPTLNALLSDPRLKNLTGERQMAAALATELAFYNYQQNLDNNLRRLLDTDPDLNQKEANYQRQLYNEIPLGTYKPKQNSHHYLQPTSQTDEVHSHLFRSLSSSNAISPESPRNITSSSQSTSKRHLISDSGDSAGSAKGRSTNSPVLVSWLDAESSKQSNSSSAPDNLNAIRAPNQAASSQASGGVPASTSKKSYRLSPLSPPPKRPAYAGDEGALIKQTANKWTAGFSADNQEGGGSCDLPGEPSGSAYKANGPLGQASGSSEKDGQQQVLGSGCSAQSVHPISSSASICNHSMRSQLPSASTTSSTPNFLLAPASTATTTPSSAKSRHPVCDAIGQKETSRGSSGLRTTPISPPPPPRPPSSNNLNGRTPTNGTSGHHDRALKCFTCYERLEDRHFVQCPSVAAHKFCFACSKEAIQRQRLKGRSSISQMGNLNDKGRLLSPLSAPSSIITRATNTPVHPPVFCPSGKKCLLANERSPWTFMVS